MRNKRLHVSSDRWPSAGIDRVGSKKEAHPKERDSQLLKIGRTLVAFPFLMNGLGLIPQEMTKEALKRAGFPEESIPFLVQVGRAVQSAGAASLVAGKFPKSASSALAAFLATATVIGHPFWKATDRKPRTQDKAAFAVPVGLLGGRLYFAIAHKKAMSEKKDGVLLLFKAKVKPGKEQELKNLFASVITSSRHDAGNLFYELHEAENDPATILLYERWVSEEHLQVHMMTAPLLASKKDVEALIEGKFEDGQNEVAKTQAAKLTIEATRLTTSYRACDRAAFARIERPDLGLRRTSQRHRHRYLHNVKGS